MAKKKSPPQYYPISIEVDGKTHTGSYSVASGMITVSSGLGSKTTQVGGSPPHAMAAQLLSELVREGRG